MSIKKDIEDVTNFLHRILDEFSSLNGFVLGLSGGVDSSVVAALAKRAVDRFNIYQQGESKTFGYTIRRPKSLSTVIMPIKSNADDASTAKLVAEHLELDPPKDIYLTDAYKNFTEAVGANWQTTSEAEMKILGNIKARMRMTALYYYANAENLLVLGTDNLTETYTGYFTKHGDGAADVFPISTFLKREVYAMAKELGLPDAVITRPPSAGLWAGQTDEDEMGIPYDFIDNSIEGMHDLNRLEYPAQAMEFGRTLSGLHASSKHKRNPPHIFTRP